jgi:hypothetical protein
MFDSTAYVHLHSLVFRGDYPGYTPAVVELPNGDGKADVDKRYAHVSLKNLANWGNGQERMILLRALFIAHSMAEQVADVLQVPKAFRPDIRYGALRVLEYPVGAISHRHKDFDLFTLHCYRSHPDQFEIHDPGPTTQTYAALARRREARDLNPGLHIGELGECVGLGPASPHEVTATNEVQHSIVYFAIPDWAAELPAAEAARLQTTPCDLVTVKDWLNERMARSRSYK